MKNKTLVIILFMMSIFVLSILPTVAQSDLDETYTADDDTFEISFPGDWSVDDSSPAFVVLEGRESRALFSFIVFSTATVEQYIDRGDDAVDILLNVADAVDFVLDDAEEFEMPGRETAIASVDLEESPGVAFVIEMDNGDYGMIVILAEVDDMTDNFEFIMSILDSYNTPSRRSTPRGEPPRTTGNSQNTSDTPEELSNFDGDWEDAIEELQDLGVIGEGGSLVFQEDSAFFTGQGYFFTALGRRSPRADIVMAGEIEFTSASSDFEHCSLMARLVDRGGEFVDVFVQVGIDNDGTVFYVDTDGEGDDTFLVDGLSLNLDLDDPHHILFILIDEFLTVYLDGVLVIDRAEVNAPRAGTYGIALGGNARGSRCDGSNIWVYELTSFEAGVCEISATGTVNKRSGPGTNFDRAGTLEAGTILEAVTQSTDSSGFVWWELEDGSWVREDVVRASGDCASVPES